MLEAVDAPVLEFAVAFYPPSIFVTAFLCVSLAITGAAYYKPLYFLGAPALLLCLGMAMMAPALGFCYEDIRAQNTLNISSNWTEGKYDAHKKVIIECCIAPQENPNDAAAVERQGDAQFAIVQLRDAIEDYSRALELKPERGKALYMKRAKAEWLDGRNADALFDWRKS